MGNAVVEADIKSFRYAGNGRNSLENVKVSVGKGETLVLFGNSGSGKSTLANCIMGICPHMIKGELKGRVAIGGIEVGKDNLSEVHSKVGIMLQNPELQILNPRVINEMAFDMENQGMEREDMQRRVSEAARFFAIEEWLYKDTDALSQGQKQILGLATMFANKPEVMVLDEPISMLDIDHKKKVLGYLQRLKQQGHTLVISTHDAEFAKRIADKILVLKEGKVVHYSSRKQLLDRFSVKRFMKKAIRKGEIVLKTENVSFEYEKRKEVLQNVSLEARKGEFIWVSGPNGGGKSTLALLLAGLLKPKTGRITVAGKDTRKADRILPAAGIVFQNPDHQIFNVTVKEELELGLDMLGLAEEEKKARLKEGMAMLPYVKSIETDPRELSYGQKKFLNITAFMIMKPDVLLLDEPDLAIDPIREQQIMRLLYGKCRKGATVIAISHNTLLLKNYATRLVYLDKKVLYDGDPMKFARFKHAVY